MPLPNQQALGPNMGVPAGGLLADMQRPERDAQPGNPKDAAPLMPQQNQDLGEQAANAAMMAPGEGADLQQQALGEGQAQSTKQKGKRDPQDADRSRPGGQKRGRRGRGAGPAAAAGGGRGGRGSSYPRNTLGDR